MVAASAVLVRERGLFYYRSFAAGLLVLGSIFMLLDTYQAGGQWADLIPLEGEDRYAGYAVVTG